MNSPPPVYENLEKYSLPPPTTIKYKKVRINDYFSTLTLFLLTFGMFLVKKFFYISKEIEFTVSFL